MRRVSGTVGVIVEHIRPTSGKAAAWAQAPEFNRAQLLLLSSPGRAAQTALRAGLGSPTTTLRYAEHG